ncbi:MAG TPA: Hsp20/alpha crystallin family protein [Steroidobacteraceae bacterium]|nr:Hsp20/alpha crystallin family protein [Steroidobacteraceae bacterium]HQX79160.1 Hsp20/alpha crystallin family protein [Steroidobacteraceae bacterium]
MSIIRWEPFRSMEDYFGRMPSLFDRWQRQLDTNGDSRLEWSPSVDISETDGEYLIRADLPAVKKEDVRVTFDDGMITVSGERKQKKEEKGEKLHRVESFYGKFTRSFSLPINVDSTSIKAESRDGVLTVRIPKTGTEQKKATEIKVQ